MARRSLLTGDERRRLFELSMDDREVARHYTLSADDLKWIEARHGAGNQLGAAVQLALLRHPGFGLRAGVTVPSPMLRYLAGRWPSVWFYQVRPLRKGFDEALEKGAVRGFDDLAVNIEQAGNAA